MLLCIYTTQAAAQALSDAVDAALGYPMAPSFVGADLAGTGEGVTLHASFIIQHPTQAQWGYAVDTIPPATLAQVGAVAPTTVNQDDWLPPALPPGGP